MLEGTRRGDGAIEALRTAGLGRWRWSRRVGGHGAWYLPGTRDRVPSFGGDGPQGVIDHGATVLSTELAQAGALRHLVCELLGAVTSAAVGRLVGTTSAVLLGADAASVYTRVYEDALMVPRSSGWPQDLTLQRPGPPRGTSYGRGRGRRPGRL